MKFENAEVFNIENAIRGMRNPMNSWDKSDSGKGCTTQTGYREFVLCKDCKLNDITDCDGGRGYYLIGNKDLELAKKLLKSPEQRKYLRQIFVSIDITAPLYWWKEMGTYKIGTTSNSTSTMHKLADTKIDITCFELGREGEDLVHPKVNDFLHYLESVRQDFLKTNDKNKWKELVRWLPESWKQTRTWTANYEVLRNIYHQRKNHKLTEWKEFCEFISTLPYAKDLIME